MSKPVAILDLEIYRDYFLALFKGVESGRVLAYEMHDGQALDAGSIKAILSKYRIVTFNGANFDIPLLTLALTGADNARVKKGSDAIILNNLRGWQFEQQFNIRVPKSIDHVDLIEVAPGIASLKIYGGRMHSRRIQDLPFEPDASIAADQRAVLRQYCENDVDTTIDLYRKLTPQIELRERMSAQYGVDLRSKSDAQIAETVIGQEVGKAIGQVIQRPELAAGTRFSYRKPEFVRFQTEPLREILQMVCGSIFRVPDNGKVIMPDELAEARIRLGASAYRLGIGGLHSSEQSVAHLADGHHILVDRDVTSYYPSIILRTWLAPKHMGKAFTEVYRGMVQTRVAAKRSGDKVTADALKITLNGSFGKFGSKWSKLYSPDLLIQTTLTGQLCLLMFIEALEAQGIPVVSANTDGIVIRCPISKVAQMHAVISKWESDTGFETEETAYSAIYSRDVNNYIAIKSAGGYKAKGAYAPAGLQKNPTAEIATDAAIQFLMNRTAVEESVTQCRDIRKFVTIRQVKGGALDQSGAYLGKAVRWYYSRDVNGPLRYKINGYTVARSEGARPLMEMPDTLPVDIDYDWYISEAYSILADVGCPNLMEILL